MKIIDVNGKERECLRVFLDPSWPGYVSVEFARKSDPSKIRIEWMPLADFKSKNTTLDTLLNSASLPPREFTSIVTSSGANTLSDTTQKLAKNIYAGYYLWISRGPGEGQTRTILSHNKNKFVLNKPWDVKPNKTSQYTVVIHLGSTDQKGNTMPL